MKIRSWPALGLVCLAASAVGCSGSGAARLIPESTVPAAPRSRAGLIPHSRPPIADVPLPAGFRVVDAMSSDRQTAEGRTADHVYDGRDDKAEVGRFYRLWLPRYGWTIASTEASDGRHTIVASKEGETLLVRIAEATGGRRFKAVTTIHVELTPRTPSAQAVSR